MTMRRVLCVWLPTLATDLVRRRLWEQAGPWPRSSRARGEPGAGDNPAVILTRAVASRELVARRCALAQAAGVSEGMDVVQARALLLGRGTLHIEPQRPDREEAALRSLAGWALRFSPLVAPDPPDGLMIDFSGTQRVHGGEDRLIRMVAAGVRRLGLAARVAAAGTPGCAWAVSRWGRHGLSRVLTGREREAIAPLPIAALRIDEATAAGLAEMAIVRVEQLLALPRASLASRFEAVLLKRLGQALGEVDEWIDPVRPAPLLRRELRFDGPTDHWESVEAASRRVLEEVVEGLAQSERGVRRLDVELARPRGEPARVQVALSRASRSCRHLWSLVRSRLERVDMGEGVEGVTMTASRTARLRHEQERSAALGGEAQERGHAAAWGELIDALTGRLGADGVVRIEAVESHLPERAFVERCAMEAPGPAAAVTAADRPTRLFASPEPAEVMALTPDGPILSLGWRGERRGVIACRGPERIGAEWWRWNPGEADGGARGRRPGAGVPPERDYFAVQTEEGRWLWVCRLVGTGRWQVHGEWS